MKGLKRLKRDYGADYVGYLSQVLEALPRNGHYRKVGHLREAVGDRHDLLTALNILEAEGLITADRSCTLITQWKLGGEEVVTPAPTPYEYSYNHK